VLSIQLKPECCLHTNIFKVEIQLNHSTIIFKLHVILYLASTVAVTVAGATAGAVETGLMHTGWWIAQ
jgi:hypothetical protein